MSTPYLGEIRAVGFSFPPVGWALCNGQSMSISENDALFALLGTTYGGDGQTTFNLPNLCSRVGIGSEGGNGGPGLSAYQPGQQGGQEAVTLTTNQMPQHLHPFSATIGATTSGTSGNTPVGNRPGNGNNPYTNSAGASMAANALTGNTSPSGGSQPHANIQPSLAMVFIMATAGIYPPQPN